MISAGRRNQVSTPVMAMIMVSGLHISPNCGPWRGLGFECKSCVGGFYVGEDEFTPSVVVILQCVF